MFYSNNAYYLIYLLLLLWPTVVYSHPFLIHPMLWFLAYSPKDVGKWKRKYFFFCHSLYHSIEVFIFLSLISYYCMNLKSRAWIVFLESNELSPICKAIVIHDDITYTYMYPGHNFRLNETISIRHILISDEGSDYNCHFSIPIMDLCRFVPKNLQ